MRTTGEIISTYLKNSNMSQHLIAEILSVTPQYISNVVNNKKSPSKNLLKDLIRILKISEEDMLLIQKYEIYRRGYLIEKEEKGIKLLGKYTNKGFKYDFSDKKIIMLNTMYNVENLAYVYILTTDLEPTFKKGISIFFELSNEIKYNNEVYLLKYKDSIDIAILEEIDDKIIIRYIEKNKKSQLLNKNEQKKLEIIGIYSGSFEIKERK